MKKIWLLFTSQTTGKHNTNPNLHPKNEAENAERHGSMIIVHSKLQYVAKSRPSALCILCFCISLSTLMSKQTSLTSVDVTQFYNPDLRLDKKSRMTKHIASYQTKDVAT